MLGFLIAPSVATSPEEATTPEHAADPFNDLAPAVAHPFGDATPRELLRALIVGETAANLSGFVASLERSSPAFASAAGTIAAHAVELRRFEDAWRPEFGGLHHVLRDPSPAFLAKVADEIADACGAIAAAGRWPVLADFACRTDEDEARGRAAEAPGMARALNDGLDLVAAVSPAYRSWIADVIRQVAPLALNGREVASWSSLHYPGLVSMTIFDSPVDMAETLVHEASHQWWHMLDRIVPLVEPKARRTPCWSAVKQRLRPLPNVLLAYHAFGNVALFFRLMRRAGLLDRAGWSYHTADLIRWLPTIASELHAAEGLTADGRHLLVTLEAKLDAHFLGKDPA